MVAVAGAIGRSPGVVPRLLLDDGWDLLRNEAKLLVRGVQSLAAMKSRLLADLSPAALGVSHAADILYVRQVTAGLLGGLAVLRANYRDIARRWRAYRTPGDKRSILQQAECMSLVDEYRTAQVSLESSAERGRLVFGQHWSGEGSDHTALENYLEWIDAFRAICAHHHVRSETVELAAQTCPDVSSVALLATARASAKTALSDLCRLVGWPEDYLALRPFGEIESRAEGLKDQLEVAPRWAAFEQSRQVVAQGVASPALQPALDGLVGWLDLPAASKRAFFMKWLSRVMEERPALAQFQSLTHEQRIADFRELDRRVLMENQAALASLIRDRVQHKIQRPGASAALRVLQDQMARQRNLKPLRRTLKEAGPAVRAIKPCWLMSPLTVAQYGEGAVPAFDLVIFDEASQLRPEDAAGAVVRGKQVVVVGDPKQLPPTSFFTVSDDASSSEDAESILERLLRAGIPQSRLKWHYRSTQESLITFSNVSFYDSDLYTFPSADLSEDRAGLSFEFVEGGIYEGKGLNAVEARRVADAVVRFAREQLVATVDGKKPQSLGVGTFNLRQQLAIQDELEKRRRTEPEIEPFFDRGRDEPFFVKNLENIQGDERDVIFISVTYGRARDGQLRYQFGPLNTQNGWRRLNVLVTRARQAMRVFSSMRGDDISPVVGGSDGPRLLREFLLYAERRLLENVRAAGLDATESPFEREVLSELLKRGLNVLPQVGVAGYRIDLGVLDVDTPGRFVCGIECDGASYHSSESARDRDRLREQVLRDRGWTLVRVWSTDWFKDRAGQVTRLIAAIESARIRLAETVRQEREAGARQMERGEREIAALSEVVPPPAENSATVTRLALPIGQPYAYARSQQSRAEQDILSVSEAELAKAVQLVVDAEAPVHLSDLTARVAEMWRKKAGSRIRTAIEDAVARQNRAGVVRMRGNFVWGARDSVVVRSRLGTGITADRIAPEELAEAILMVLAGGRRLSRPELIAETRSVLGYQRTGDVIEAVLSVAISKLLASGQLGEASNGLGMRLSN